MAVQLDELSRPVPGQSLTNSPDTPRPYETPVESSSVSEALQKIFVGLGDRDIFNSISDSLREEIPVEDIAKMIAFESFRSGKVSPDVSLLLLEPLMYLIVYIADIIGVEATILPEDPMDVDNEDILEALRGSTEESIEAEAEEGIAPEGVTSSILDAIKSQGEGEKDDGL